MDLKKEKSGKVGIKGYNWVNPLVIFLILHHFVDVAYGARRYLEQSFALDEVVETSQGGYLIVCIVTSLIVGGMWGALHIWLGNKNEKVKEYWENDYWKDVACFCIVLVVAQIVSAALLGISFNLNSPLEVFLEKVFCVLRFISPQAILILRTIPGAVVYYFMMMFLKKKA